MGAANCAKSDDLFLASCSVATARGLADQEVISAGTMNGLRYSRVRNASAFALSRNFSLSESSRSSGPSVRFDFSTSTSLSARCWRVRAKVFCTSLVGFQLGQSLLNPGGGCE